MSAKVPRVIKLTLREYTTLLGLVEAAREVLDAPPRESRAAWQELRSALGAVDALYEIESDLT